MEPNSVIAVTITSGQVSGAAFFLAVASFVFTIYRDLRDSKNGKRELAVSSPVLFDSVLDGKNDDTAISIHFTNTGSQENRVKSVRTLLVNGSHQEDYSMYIPKPLEAPIQPLETESFEISIETFRTQQEDGDRIVGIEVEDFGGRSYFQPVRYFIPKVGYPDVQYKTLGMRLVPVLVFRSKRFRKTKQYALLRKKFYADLPSKLN